MEQYNPKYMLIRSIGIMKQLHKKTYDQKFDRKMYPGQPQIMLFLKHCEGISQKELAKKHTARPASITGMLQKLEKQGLVKRIPDEQDKRILRVYLTEKGEKIAQQSEKFMEQVAQTLFQNFTLEEKECYMKLLEKMSKNIADQERNIHEEF